MVCARQVLRFPNRRPTLLTPVTRLQRACSRVLRWCRLHLWCGHCYRAPRHHGVQRRLGQVHGGVCCCGTPPDPLSEPQLFVSVWLVPNRSRLISARLHICIASRACDIDARLLSRSSRHIVFSKFCTMSAHHGVYPSWSKCKACSCGERRERCMRERHASR